MNGFSADWLAAREPWDHRARALDILSALIHWSTDRGPGAAARRRILDLGSGTGSTVRYVEPRLNRPIAWHLVDGDPALLRIAGESRVTHSDSTLSTTVMDISRADPDQLIGETDLITASALFDLVSMPWLVAFWRSVAARRAGVLAGLCYDGRSALIPAHKLDAVIRDLVNHHQITDKGFGPALGPQATAALTGLARRDGWRVMIRRSDWDLAMPDDQAGIPILLAGWAQAATEMAPGLSGQINDWLAERLATPGLRVRVGHRDLLALPPA